MLIRGLVAAAFVAVSAGGAAADTLFVEGRMAGRVTVDLAERYEPRPGMEWLRLRSFKTPSFVSPTWKQTVISDDVRYSIGPTKTDVARDGANNAVLTEQWDRPRVTVEVTRRIVVDIEAGLAPVSSRSPFPAGPPSAETSRYLAATRQVQKDDPRVQDESRRLTSGATTQHQAVTAILNFVTDRLTWKLEPPGHDAITGLTGGVVNCQGYSHLSIALLRAAGIPARVAVGITLSKGWQVPTDGGPLVMKMGTGRHAWIEIFYPDLGWVPFDAQSTHLFVSLYHVRQAVGLDVEEAATIISGLPMLPGMHETIQGDGAGEAFNMRMVSRGAVPRNYVIASRVRDVTASPPAPPPPPPPVVTPPPLPSPSPLRRQDFTNPVELGNLDFPASLRIFAPRTPAGAGLEASRTFVVETADYATGADELAQAFTLDKPMLVTDIALAMQKFGGSLGDLWIELREDRGRKPGPTIVDSERLRVAQLITRGGYRWVVFPLSPRQGGQLLHAGRYWAVLRSTGDGIFNWYFSLGSTYGDPDDSRAGARGAADWPAILNYRFNFRVSGLAKP
jgi:transglutaminase-like putative cysteine protease